jgi:cyclophilin family peptidyl-prolyl cis-trans isomerase
MAISFLNFLVYGDEMVTNINKSSETAKATVNVHPMVKMETNKGNITIELFSEKAPISVGNFLAYVHKGFYDGTIFHRVIKNFMIQCGGFNVGLQQKEALFSQILNEANNGLKNKKGTLAMARTSFINSATSQFFINLVDNGFLDHKNESMQGYGYAVFGQVTEGMDVVEAIGLVPTTTVGYYGDVPKEDIIITKVTVLNA